MEQTNEIAFSVTPSRIPNSVTIYTYTLPVHGVSKLIRVHFNPDAAAKFMTAALNEAPLSIHYTAGKIPIQFKPMSDVGCTVKDISKFDVSFENFWNAYANKVGDLKRVRKKWETLCFEDRILAFGFINRLRAYYTAKNLVFPFPETYINQRRWENIL